MAGSIRKTIACMIGGSAIALGIPTPVRASTECLVDIERVWSGDNGNFWLHYSTGGSAYLSAGDPDLSVTASLATTALATGKRMIVRYSADNVACTEFGRSDVAGVYLIR